METKSFEELRDQLGKILNIDFSDITNGYNKIEQRICEQANFDELTEEQWREILEKNGDLFQDGIPHVSWNTDRSEIFHTINKNYKSYTGDSWDETWYHVIVLYYKFKSGVVIRLKKEEPIVWGGNSRTRYFVNIVPEDKLPKINTHTAVIFSVNKTYGKVHIVEQYTGTEDEAADWLLERGKKYGDNCFARIIKFAE